jgi:hypothetical protein
MRQILAMQLELQQLIASKSNKIDHSPCAHENAFTNGDMVHYIKDQAYFLQQEIAELAEEFGGKDVLKPWKANHNNVASGIAKITAETKSEAIDALCFCMNICLAAGITPENIMDEYSKVWLKNVDRQHNGY